MQKITVSQTAAVRLRARPASEEDLGFLSLLSRSPSTLRLGRAAVPDAHEPGQEKQAAAPVTGTRNLIIEMHGRDDSWEPVARVIISSTAQLSADLSPGLREQQLGKAVLKTAIAYIRRNQSIKELTVQILPDDAPSIAVFRQAGFIHTADTTVSGQVYARYVYTLPKRQFGLFY